MPCTAGMSAALLRAPWGISQHCTATGTRTEGRPPLARPATFFRHLLVYPPGLSTQEMEPPLLFDCTEPKATGPQVELK